MRGGEIGEDLARVRYGEHAIDVTRAQVAAYAAGVGTPGLVGA